VSKARTILAWSCTHFPLADPDAIDWLLDQIRDVRPDILVHLGDLYEADGASRWGSEYPWDLLHEYRTADAFLRRVRSVSPQSRKIFIPGNHDDNILAVQRID